MVLAAEPWAYLFAWLSQREHNSRGQVRERYRKAVYFSDLAESFYRASEATPLPAKATLAYYGMLNLAKGMLAANGSPLEKQRENHGLTIPENSELEINIYPPNTKNLNIFHELAAALGSPVTHGQRLSVHDIVPHIPELHAIAHSTGHLTSGKQGLLPIEVDLLVNESKDKIFSQVRFKKKYEHLVRTGKFKRGSRREYFGSKHEEDGEIVYRSCRRKNFSGTDSNWKTVYRNICREYEKFDVSCVLTRDGYRYYCDLENPAFHHLAYSFLLLFYFGAVVRYRPTQAREILRSDLRPMISEAVSLIPNQFLYQIVSRLTQRICVVPKAAIR